MCVCVCDFCQTRVLASVLEISYNTCIPMNRNQEKIHQSILLCDICPNLLLCEGGDFSEVLEKKFILLKNSQSSLCQLSFSSLCSIVSLRIQSVDYIIAIIFTF